MRSAAVFGFRLSWAAITVGAVGAAGAVVAIVDPGSAFSAASALATVVFHGITGRRTLKLGNHVVTGDSR